jgi:hypothetical protein
MTPEQRTTLNWLWRSRSRMMDDSRRDAIRAALAEIDAQAAELELLRPRNGDTGFSLAARIEEWKLRYGKGGK